MWQSGCNGWAANKVIALVERKRAMQLAQSNNPTPVVVHFATVTQACCIIATVMQNMADHVLLCAQCSDVARN